MIMIWPERTILPFFWVALSDPLLTFEMNRAIILARFPGHYSPTFPSLVTQVLVTQLKLGLADTPLPLLRNTNAV